MNRRGKCQFFIRKEQGKLTNDFQIRCLNRQPQTNNLSRVGMVNPADGNVRTLFSYLPRWWAEHTLASLCQFPLGKGWMPQSQSQRTSLW